MTQLKTPADIISLRALSSPDKIIARDLVGNRQWTYADFNSMVDGIAATLEEQVKPGERVAILSKNSVELLALYFACIRVACIFVPLNWRLPKAELQVLLDIATPVLMFHDSSHQGILEHSILIDSFIDNALAKESSRPMHIAKEMGRPALILFTSGTSGTPKGVLLSFQNLISSGFAFAQMTAVSEKSHFLCEAPMFHTIGLVANIWPVLLSGGSVSVSDGFIPERTLDWLSDEELGISHYVGVPQMIEGFRALDSFDAGKLRKMTALVTGGAPHPAADIKRWVDEGVCLVSGFGMSETGSVFGMPVNIDSIKNKLGSVGVPAPETRAKIVNEQGRDCEPNQAGELLLKGSGNCLEYFNNKSATESAFTHDGWFKTGDIAQCDADGYFWIVDRKKDMFISGGENVYPAEIEAALKEYPGMSEYAVIGITDDKWGEVGCIVTVVEDGESLNEEALFAFLKTRLASYKVPKKLVIKENLPRTSTGKLQKQKLKQDILRSLEA